MLGQQMAAWDGQARHGDSCLARQKIQWRLGHKVRGIENRIHEHKSKLSLIMRHNQSAALGLTGVQLQATG
jgi:hypothetical protein